MPLAEVEALLGGPAAGSFAMPADYQAYRWQREGREGSEAVVVQLFADGRVRAAAGQGRPGHGKVPRWIISVAATAPRAALNVNASGKVAWPKWPGLPDSVPATRGTFPGAWSYGGAKPAAGEPGPHAGLPWVSAAQSSARSGPSKQPPTS